jgi:hypothetical protein
VRRIIQGGGFQKNGEINRGANELKALGSMDGLQMSRLCIPAGDDAGSEKSGFM